MKKLKINDKITLITFIITFLIMVVANIIIFVNYDQIIKCGQEVFWTTWAFSFPINLLIIGGVLLFTLKAKGDLIIKAPVFYFLIIYEVISLITGCCFFFIENNAIAACVTTELVITILFVAAMLYVYGAFSYITKNQKVVKENVAFIKGLNVKLTAYIDNVTDINLKADINNLAENIKFSDPMTVDAVKDMDREIASNVQLISDALENSSFEGVSELVKKTTQKLKARNELLKVSK